MTNNTATIRQLTDTDIEELLPQLANLLIDAVASGTSIGFHPPLGPEEAARYWCGILAEVEAGSRIVLAAIDGDSVAGCVQLQLCGKPNGRHRAEVQKLIVHTSQRRRGLGRLLMRALEDVAREHGRNLLVLDTRTGDVAEQLYLNLGYTRFGIVPGYTIDPDAAMHDTSFMYRAL